MATAASQEWLEDELTCPICLQVYADPVILSCKHSFCQSCIEETWKEPVSGSYCCPECRAEGKERPVLEKNFKLANIAQKYLALESGQNAVLCNYCIRKQLPAIKTCMKCEASMCPIHLKLHTQNGAFRNHPLVDTASDLSVWKCPEHEKLLDIYCKDDQLCVCTLCTLIGKHKNHNCGSISEGEKELRENLKHQQKSVQQNVETVQMVLRDLHTYKLNTQALIAETKQEVKEKYDALRKHIEREELDVFRCLDKEQNRVMVAIDAQIQELQTKMKSLEKCLTDLTELHLKREKLAFIQGFHSMAGRIKDTSQPIPLPQSHPRLDKIKLDKLKNQIQRNYEMVSQVQMGRDNLISLYGQAISPDPDTAHFKLVLSDSNRTVSLSQKKQPLPRNLERFDCCQQVICSEGIKCGRSYWEVEIVGDGGVWKVGVCYRSISRKGKSADCLLGRNNTSWCLYSLLGSVLALHDDSDTKLPVVNVSRVGVFVDFEAGIISFYSVSGRKLCLLHTFREQMFTEPLYPALQVGDFSTILSLCALK
ncbi:E3 ubiquitin/ISG15 ligase TRIM25-like [Callorhinchus milii]|uniref:E3 ubiquitin/ISG15 ligase TRIM25-like n=1 Tax=Callorhinchus milii TaxID=7868 RepID=UPI0004571AB9|nr:E3 ubiquitin/ISG15 ligase TRIM25-like [Callorhinchus milii]|eukprot:gi/632966149/ref/XP_007899259.1/ PREDICTED: tripartite motif-containing protein 60-like [Callorhinchus milii]